MKATPLTLTLASALALGAAAPAAAQYVDPQAQREYRDRVEDYNEAAERYNEATERYNEHRQDYAANRAEYERQRADWERRRADYDRRYGYGAYERRYGAFVYEDYGRGGYADGDYGRRDYDRTYDRYYDRGYGRSDDRAYRGYDYSSSSYGADPCERSRDNRTVAGGLIGALAGAAIGSNVADDNVRSEGAVLGAVVGGALGAGVGRSTAQCDGDGYYFTYNQTYPYREPSAYGGYRGYRSGRYDYDYYSRQRCRLAAAPAFYRGSTDYRYVRVCPDSRGRYRITE